MTDRDLTPDEMEKLNEEIFGEIDQLEVHAEIDEFLETGPEVMAVSTKADQLEIDMRRLADLDAQVHYHSGRLAGVQDEVDEFLKSKGLDELKDDAQEQKKIIKKDYDLLKKDIGERGLEIHEKTKNTDPAPGVKIQKSKKDDVELVVDDAEAIKWLIEKELITFLTYDRKKYIDQLDLGSFPDMPGELKKTPVFKPSISLKPYQSED